jgi:hypothetical protein
MNDVVTNVEAPGGGGGKQGYGEIKITGSVLRKVEGKKSKKGNKRERERVTERREGINPSRPNHLLTLPEHFVLCTLSLQASVGSTQLFC